MESARLLEREPGHGKFIGLVESVREPPVAIKGLLDSFVIKDAFKVQTLFAVGALLQIALSSVVPRPWNLIPALSLGLGAIGKTISQCLFHHTNVFIQDTIHGRSTALLPSATGDYGSVPAARSLVVFHFGVRFNHPLGILSPGARETANHFRAMIDTLNQDAATQHDYGLLGASPFRGGERGSHATLLYVFYFENVDGLRRFAAGHVHQMGMRFLRGAGNGHISAFHETFVVPEGSYESVYLDSAPVLLGATTWRCRETEDRDGAGGDSFWASPLVSANTPRLMTMAARLREEDKAVDV